MALPLLTMSLMEGQEVIDSDKGQMIVLPCKVEGLTITTVGDPQVLTKCVPALPGLYAPHPDSTNFPNATLRERRVRSVRSPNIAFVDLIYRTNFGPSDFVLEEISQTEYLQTQTCAGGAANIQVWYQSGASAGATSPPAGVKLFTASAQRFYGKTILKATGWMLYTDWQKVRSEIRAARWHINSMPWGNDLLKDDRGMWLFANMTTRTDDKNFTKAIELYFINDPGGWYPITGYTDPSTGLRPTDAVTENALRAKGPPIVGSQWTMNGLTRSSVYEEIDFNPLFTFSPSDT